MTYTQVLPPHHVPVIWMPQEASSLRPVAWRRWVLPRDLLPEPGEGPVAFPLFAEHAREVECLSFAPCEAVEPSAESHRVKLVVLHSLAPLIPVLRLHDAVGRKHRRDLAVRLVAEIARFEGGEGLAGEALLIDHKALQPVEGRLQQAGSGVIPLSWRATKNHFSRGRLCRA